ncbi:hypothetical protein OIU77_024129 [Salix suchowensis]|uniref:Pentatricopeptide repeat-containing protein n=1 Tax=Salix suchowensis TaxID=1278906 RepID=A0ABQ9C6B5_9ROSI|nr:hypothetical protein OIU77_024129 [Salix suchowensis]
MSQLKQYHSQIIRLGLSSHNHLIPPLVNFCARANTSDALTYALKLFDSIPQPDDFLYNTIIKGFLHSQLLPTNFILLFYSHMLQNSVLPNNFTFPSLLRACRKIQHGKQIHAHLLKFGFGAHSVSLNSLIHMYVTYQALEEARRVFYTIPHPDSVSWTSLISGYSKWGLIDEAFTIFQLMPQKDSASWNAMMAAYVQTNRFHEAFALFDRMKTENNNEARKLIDEMPLTPDVTVLGTLLGACKKYRNIELGEEIGRRVIELEPNNSGRYVLLANLYANAGKWEGVAKVRKLMDDRGVKKAPGFSMIELQGTVHEFIAGERNHPQANELHAKVYEMLEHLKSVGYVADTIGALHDIQDESAKMINHRN